MLPAFGGAAVLLLLLVLTLAGRSTDTRASLPETRIGSSTPVVLVVFDELPSVTLMSRDGRISASRYPNIARFAAGSTWYRDNVAAGDFTAWALPGILTGKRVNELTLPTAQAQPDNLFSLFGPGRRVHALERVTRLCPTDICGPGPVGDTDGIERADDFVKAMFHPFDPAALGKWIRGIPAGSGTLSFAHVELPHAPLRFLPSGQTYPGGPLAMPVTPSRKYWAEGDGLLAFVHSRHLLQAGYADRLFGRIVNKIRANGDFDDALIILTADHGLSFDPRTTRRQASPENQGSVLNPPLIIKYPGQETGVISTASTQGLDIFATIADQLGVSAPPGDGQVAGTSGPNRKMTVSLDDTRQMTVDVRSIRASRAEILASQYRRLGSGSLWQLGPRPDLIGTRPGFRVFSRARFRLHLSARTIIRADRSNRELPSLLSGDLKLLGPGATLALAWNGEIVATGQSFSFGDKIRFGLMVPPRVMKKEDNRIALYRVLPDGRLLRLRPALAPEGR